ncbi:hypothetical protein LCGC14_0451340 [marine sediment metagenome]|uniref:Uncharacterized protein n=1 Tax=marine sediment metagenome TaxID=412755 RepID=A0A0F9VRV3_9ZZZZ
MGLTLAGISPFSSAAVYSGAAAACVEPLAFVSVQSGGVNLTDVVTTLTLSNVVIAASTCPLRLQLALIARENVYVGPSTAIQDVTRGGVSMTFGFSFGSTTPISCGPPSFCARMEMWYILNPLVGTEDIVVTTLGVDAAGAGIIASAWQFNGVNQIAPFGAEVAAGSQTEQHSLNVPSNIGELVVAWIHGRHNHDLTEPGGGQTNRYTELHHGPASTDRHAESKGATLAGASTVNVRWDNAGNNQDESITVGLSLRPA